jgi:hypothetical protein
MFYCCLIKISLIVFFVILIFLKREPFFIARTLVLLRGVLGVMGGSYVCKWLFISIFIVFLGGIIILFFYIISLSIGDFFFFNDYFFLRVLLIFRVFIAPSLPIREISQASFLRSLYNSRGSQSLF